MTNRLMRSHITELQKEISRRRKIIGIPRGKRIQIDAVCKADLNELLDWIENKIDWITETKPVSKVQ